MSATVVVARPPTVWIDRLRAYRVLVDGEERGRLRPGESVSIEVEPGAHVVQGKIDWTRSAELSLDLSDGESVAVELGPNANPFTVLWFATVGSRRYLRLERRDEPVRTAD